MYERVHLSSCSRSTHLDYILQQDWLEYLLLHTVLRVDERFVAATVYTLARILEIAAS